MQELGVRELYSVWVCYTSSYATSYVDLILMAYTVILQIVAIVLCFQTRKVKVAALNDSKFVATIVYLSSIILFMLILATFTLRGHVNIGNGVIIGGILTLASVFLSLTYIPRVSQLTLLFRTLFWYFCSKDASKPCPLKSIYG